MAKSVVRNLGLQNQNMGFDSPLGLQIFIEIYTHIDPIVHRLLTKKEWMLNTDEGYHELLRLGSANPKEAYWKKFKTYHQYVEEYKSTGQNPVDVLDYNSYLGYYSSDGKIWSRYVVRNPRYAACHCMKESLIEKRLRARQEKDYKEADHIRDYYKSLLVDVIDGVYPN